MSTHFVNALSLNLRRTPNSQSNTNIIVTLPEGQGVELLEGRAGDAWWRIATEVQSKNIVGFVAARFLTESDHYDTRTFRAVEEIHMVIQNPQSQRNLKTGRAHPLGEADKPFRDTADVASKVNSIHKAVKWLDVEHKARYGPETTKTFCNIYAYDYCYLGRAFLPRVWWASKALIKLATGIPVQASYGQTINEMNANSLYHWLEEYGPDFGWERVFDVDEIQLAANKGDVCVICARRVNLNESGHITVVLPEKDDHTALRTPQTNKVRIPLQSQAGRSNRMYFNDRKWWTKSHYQSFGFWRHD
ncbi:MAG: hypothetical protein ACKV1O_02355 [Saprospiraceae bacterium]